MNLSSKAWVGIVCGLPWAAVLAEPLAAAESRRQLVESPAVVVEPAESPVDVQSWIQREAAVALLDGEFEADRRAMLRQGWQGQAPTWIQSTSAVNLGDFPTLDDSTERAERDLKTLEWVIEEQRRLAAGTPSQDAGPVSGGPQDNWLRRLLPTRWIATLKANREWVAAGGTALLVIAWGTATFARRPTTHPLPPPPPEPAPRKRRRHRDHGHRAG